ncbi:hypothetical protein SAMN05421630_103549 [Prauserella marina]|uniref:Uncharacterized protein n=1 Tax=Prauserella marina TaxID=530584 RepID=A0A1G6P9I4_9PSEU|nr:hypothetical protein DES30_1021013 [Prauserella marina]SDC76783.1 hypothetical protein SAMN05421630_103549 [Prauserella marina]
MIGGQQAAVGLSPYWPHRPAAESFLPPPGEYDRGTLPETLVCESGADPAFTLPKVTGYLRKLLCAAARMR